MRRNRKARRGSEYSDCLLTSPRFPHELAPTRVYLSSSSSSKLEHGESALDSSEIAKAFKDIIAI